MTLKTYIMPQSTPSRFALIGTGGIAQTHIQAFQNTSHAKLVAAVDVRAEAVQAVADAMNCMAFQSVDELLKEHVAGRCSIDAAIVCTPPSTHPEICVKLSEAGIHVLCEKPIAVSRTAALEMIAAANAYDKLFTMASKFRYVADMIYAKQLITSGVLGEILLFENSFAGHVDMTRRWNSNPSLSGGGVFIDNGTHSVDIIRYLLGPIATIHTLEGKRMQSIPVEDTVRVHAKTQDGALAAIDLSWSINKQSPWYVSVYGSEGTVLVGWQESKYRRDNDKEWTVFGKGYNKVQAFTDQLNNFSLAIQGEAKLLITSDDALASVDAVAAGYESLRRDDWVSVAPIAETNQVATAV
jgi:predicted dehydrogenase